MHLPSLAGADIDSVITSKETKRAKKPSAAGASTAEQLSRSRYMQENKKQKTFQGWFCAALDFQNLIIGEAVAVTRVIRFQMRE